MGIIKTKNLVHEFFRRDEEGNVESITTALDHVDLDVKEGQFIAILGHNGSGKSTLAKHINALLSASEGTIWVDGMDVSEEENVIPVRRSAVGIVGIADALGLLGRIFHEVEQIVLLLALKIRCLSHQRASSFPVRVMRGSMIIISTSPRKTPAMPSTA